MRDAGGKTVGEVTLTQTRGGGTLVNADLHDLPPGTHALHIHSTGACKPPFESAGGHFNPDAKAHGFAAAGGPHAGDLPNIHVPGSGNLTVEAHTARLPLDARLFDSDGAAIVIHEGRDDYRSDPAGKAGSRIACGVIRR